jgi:hypothetical protein
MKSKRKKLRGLLLDMAEQFFSKRPPAPYIRARFTDSKQRYFRGRLWYDSASFQAGEDPMIDLKGYPDETALHLP